MLSTPSIAALTVRTARALREEGQRVVADARIQVEHALIGKVRMASSFTRMSETQAELRVASPPLGEHVSEILGELGYSESHIEALRRGGVTA